MGKKKAGNKRQQGQSEAQKSEKEQSQSSLQQKPSGSNQQFPTTSNQQVPTTSNQQHPQKSSQQQQPQGQKQVASGAQAPSTNVWGQKLVQQKSNVVPTTTNQQHPQKSSQQQQPQGQQQLASGAQTPSTNVWGQKLVQQKSNVVPTTTNQQHPQISSQQQQSQGQQQLASDAQAPSTNVWGQKLVQQKSNLGGVSRPQNTTCVIPAQRTIEASSVIQKTEIKRTSTESSRGNMRGSRYIDADFLLKSRPTDLQSKQGTVGRKVTLQANYFAVSETYEKGLNQYHVYFTPELETKYRKQIIARNKEKFGAYIFDGTKIYTKLSFNDFEFTTKSDLNAETIKVNVKFVGAIHLHNSEWIQLCNIILRRSMDGLKLQLIGRNLFNALQKIQISDLNLEIWPGYITSFRQHERNLLLCCDIIHKVMRNETVLFILRRVFDESCKGRTDFKTLARSELLGSVVLTDYNNKTYRIDDIDFESNPGSLFPTAKGNVSYFNYYKQRYNINIKDTKQPLLISKPLEKTYRSSDKESTLIKLVPELCRATGITDAMKRNTRLMLQMGSHTKLSPGQRIQRLHAFQKGLYNTKESVSVLEEFNLKIDQNLVEIPGRMLPEPVLVFANNQKLNRYQWESCFRTNSLLKAAQIKNWYVIIPREPCERDVKNFVRICQDVGRKMGFQLSDPQFIMLQNDNNMAYSKALEQVCSKDPQIVMIFTNTNRLDLYGCIKKKMICDRAVPSQVVQMKTVRRLNGLESVATKVCVQMNAKLKFAPWTVEMPARIMCIGFDVCHSTRDRNKSYGALVASMDVNIKPGVYFSAVSEHIKGNEMSNDIAINVTKALRQFAAEHNVLPSIIFFYRDGVGDGQLHQIFEHEINHVIKSIEKVYQSAKATFKISYIVVSKRINTRLFSNGRDGKTNPEPGTVVDDVITLPQRYDFFLISQSVREGTVSPTSYNVLFDNTKLPADRIQDMTYRQTHMYYNYFATVRVPAVCQYAHKLAYLVGESLHQAPNSLLEKSLYYL